MNQTIKDLLRKAPEAFPHQWDWMLDPLLFALRESPQFSTGLSPFDLVYGWKPHSLLQNLRQEWAPSEPTPATDQLSYVHQLKDHLNWAHQTATKHLRAAQAKQKRAFDRTAVERKFQQGDRVLVRSLSFSRSATKEWEGPFTVTKVVNPLTYEVRCGPRSFQSKILYVNHLKQWYPPEADVQATAWSDIQPAVLSDGDLPWSSSTTAPGSEEWPQVDNALTEGQCNQAQRMLYDYKTLFSTKPGRIK